MKERPRMKTRAEAHRNRASNRKLPVLGRGAMTLSRACAVSWKREIGIARIGNMRKHFGYGHFALDALRLCQERT